MRISFQIRNQLSRTDNLLWDNLLWVTSQLLPKVLSLVIKVILWCFVLCCFALNAHFIWCLWASLFIDFFLHVFFPPFPLWITVYLMVPGALLSSGFIYFLLHSFCSFEWTPSWTISSLQSVERLCWNVHSSQYACSSIISELFLFTIFLYWFLYWLKHCWLELFWLWVCGSLSSLCWVSFRSLNRWTT